LSKKRKEKDFRHAKKGQLDEGGRGKEEKKQKGNFIPNQKKKYQERGRPSQRRRLKKKKKGVFPREKRGDNPGKVLGDP